MRYSLRVGERHAHLSDRTRDAPTPATCAKGRETDSDHDSQRNDRQSQEPTAHCTNGGV